MTSPHPSPVPGAARSRKGISALEFRDQIALVQLLERFPNPNWQWTHLAHGEKRDPGTGRKLKLMGLRRGWPDMVFVRSDGRMFWLELKRAHTGRLSKDQTEVLPFLMRAGHGVLVTNSLDDAIATLIDIGVLPDRVHLQ